MFKNQDQAVGWLAGIIDGEGSVSMRPNRNIGSQSFTREVRITNTDVGMLVAAEHVLRDLGVDFKRYDRSDRERLGNKPIYDISITGKENLDKLHEVLPLMTTKKHVLHQAVTSYVRKNRPPQDELEQHVAAGLSDAQIAERYGVTAGAVWFWRKHYGIEAADRTVLKEMRAARARLRSSAPSVVGRARWRFSPEFAESLPGGDGAAKGGAFEGMRFSVVKDLPVDWQLLDGSGSVVGEAGSKR